MSVAEKIKSWFITPDQARKLTEASFNSQEVLKAIYKHIKSATEGGQYVTCFNVDFMEHAAYKQAVSLLTDMGYTVQFWENSSSMCMSWTVSWFPDKACTEQRPDFGFKPKKRDPLRCSAGAFCYGTLAKDGIFTEALEVQLDTVRTHDFEANVPASIREVLYLLEPNKLIGFVQHHDLATFKMLISITNVQRYDIVDIYSTGKLVHFKVKLKEQ